MDLTSLSSSQESQDESGSSLSKIIKGAKSKGAKNPVLFPTLSRADTDSQSEASFVQYVAGTQDMASTHIEQQPKRPFKVPSKTKDDKVENWLAQNSEMLTTDQNSDALKLDDCSILKALENNDKKKTSSPPKNNRRKSVRSKMKVENICNALLSKEGVKENRKAKGTKSQIKEPKSSTTPAKTTTEVDSAESKMIPTEVENNSKTTKARQPLLAKFDSITSTESEERIQIRKSVGKAISSLESTAKSSDLGGGQNLTAVTVSEVGHFQDFSSDSLKALKAKYEAELRAKQDALISQVKKKSKSPVKRKGRKSRVSAISTKSVKEKLPKSPQIGIQSSPKAGFSNSPRVGIPSSPKVGFSNSPRAESLDSPGASDDTIPIEVSLSSTPDKSRLAAAAKTTPNPPHFTSSPVLNKFIKSHKKSSKGPVNNKLLKGVIVAVDVRTLHENRSRGIANKLSEYGATVMPKVQCKGLGILN